MEDFKDQMNSYKNFDDFAQSFIVDDAMLSLLVTQAASDKINCSVAQLRQEDLLLTQIKAYLARRLFEPSDFYKVVNPETDIFKQGVELLTKTREYSQLLK